MYATQALICQYHVWIRLYKHRNSSSKELLDLYGTNRAYKINEFYENYRAYEELGPEAYEPTNTALASCSAFICGRHLNLHPLSRWSGFRGKMKVEITQQFKHWLLLVVRFLDITSFDDWATYDIADVLKIYFRELPEPLLTVKLADTFLSIHQRKLYVIFYSVSLSWYEMSIYSREMCSTTVSVIWLVVGLGGTLQQMNIWGFF